MAALSAPTPRPSGDDDEHPEATGAALAQAWANALVAMASSEPEIADYLIDEFGFDAAALGVASGLSDVAVHLVPDSAAFSRLCRALAKVLA